MIRKCDFDKHIMNNYDVQKYDLQIIKILFALEEQKLPLVFDRFLIYQKSIVRLEIELVSFALAF